MNAIRNQRLKRSLTQKRLAFEAGIDARTLRKIEKGEKVSPESVLAVCSILELDVEDFAKAPQDVGTSSPISKTADADASEASSVETLMRSVIALAPAAILAPAATVAFCWPDYALPALVTSCLAAVLFATLADLPCASRPRSYIGGGLLALTVLIGWRHELEKYGNDSIHIYILLGTLSLTMLSSRLRDIILQKRVDGERSFERVMVGVLLFQAYLSVRGINLYTKGVLDPLHFYRWLGSPVEAVFALTLLPFRWLRGVGYLTVGIVSSVRLPDFPILLYYGGNPKIYTETLFEMGLYSVIWDGSVALLALVCALQHFRAMARIPDHGLYIAFRQRLPSRFDHVQPS
jgi:transcriptional regulator with XRE-family HTH domain